MQKYRLQDLFEKTHRLTLSVCKLMEQSSDSASITIVNRVQAVAVSMSENVALAYAQALAYASDDELEPHLVLANGYLHRLEYLLRLAHDMGSLDDLDYKRESLAASALKLEFHHTIQALNFYIE